MIKKYYWIVLLSIIAVIVMWSIYYPLILSNEKIKEILIKKIPIGSEFEKTIEYIEKKNKLGN